MQPITPFLWFDDQAEEAADFYVSLFPNSKISHVTRYSEAGPGEPGTVMTVDFELNGRPFVAPNGGPGFWERLSEGAERGPCGWLKDRFALSWQVVPTVLEEPIRDPDPEKSQRVVRAMLRMGKLEIEPLRRAYERAAEPAPGRS